MKKALVSLFLFTLPLIGLQADITGTYIVENCCPTPSGEVCIKGFIEITKTCDNKRLFTVTYHYEDLTSFTGTAIKKNDTLAINWRDDSNPTNFGIEVWKIEDDELKGPYVTFGECDVCKERLTKM